MRHLAPALLISLLLPLSLFAQRNPQPLFRNYSTEHGLPSPETYFAMQDSRGYMWFGTDNGAARFDGYSFQTYGAKEGLTSNVVFDIHEDAKGRIWFGTMTGEAFILEGDTIMPYRFNHLVQQYRGQFADASLVYLQPEVETAYFELKRLGILKIDSIGTEEIITAERAHSKIILEAEGYDQGLRNQVERYFEGEEHQFWVNYEQEHQLALLESVSPRGKIQMELPYYTYPTCKIDFNAQRLSNGNWLIMHCNHLFYLEKEEIIWTVPFTFKVNEIVETKDQAIWLCGKEGAGLRRYTNLNALKKGEYSLYLEGLSISNLYQDDQGGYWVTTLEQGLFYCSDIELLNYDIRFGFSSNLITALTFKNGKTLFAGCKNGDIFEVDLENNRIKNTLISFRGHFNHELFYHPGRQQLWSGSAYWKDGQWNFIKRWEPATQKWRYTRFSRLEKTHLNPKGNLVGSSSSGIFIIDLKNDTIIVDPYHFNLRERTFAVHTDQQQRLWVGNARGIFEFRDSSLVAPDVDHPAFHARVEDIHEFPNGSLVFGTKGWGVVRWQGEQILLLSTDDGLTSNMIEDVHVDEKGILWVGTLNGLNKITFDSLDQPKIRSFTVANGLPSNEITKIRSYQGEVWLCTPKGLVHFHEQPEDTVSAAPMLQGLTVNGDPIEMDRTPVFSYQENRFDFQFLAINYRQFGDINYRFRLNDQQDWSYTQNLSVAPPQLRWGNYRFEVQAQNQDGYWSPSTAYAFEIRPPWWASNWFISLCALLFLAAGFGFYQYRTAQLMRENRIQQQITNLERSALQAQMNPHFIFNCLNSIQNFILQNDRKRAVEYLSRFAQLVRHNLNASVQGQVSLEEELSLLDNYLALERERFEQRFDYTLKADEALNQQFIAFPPLLIQPYVENAIIHGLSKKEEKGKVDVHISRENGSLVVSVRDNGPGYQADLKTKQSGRHKSVGMTITQKRLEMLGNNPEKAVQIATLNGEEGISGTEVKIFIDLNKTTWSPQQP